MYILNPLRKDRLKLNGGVGKHVLWSSQCTHRIIMNVKTKTVES